MADTLTDELKDRFRRKIGDTSGTPAFSDVELQDLYDEADGSFTLAVLLAFEELVGNATKLTNYSEGNSSESRQQIFANLVNARDMWKEKFDEESKGRQIRMTRMRQMRMIPKARPRS